MRFLALIPFATLIFNMGMCARAQTTSAGTPPWTGIVAASRAVDWSQAGVTGGIPSRTTICATISPEGTAAAPVAPTDINNAIAACPAGQVVYLSAGSYYLSTGIDFTGHSNVTLRGAGADKTLLYFYSATGCGGGWADVCVHSNDPNWQKQPTNTANWTGGYTRGTTQITLDNTSNIIPGQTLLILDQPDDTATDTGSIWTCMINNVCSTNDGPSTSDGRPGRNEFQIVQATAVSGNSVTINPPVEMPNILASKTAEIVDVIGGDYAGNGVTTNFTYTALDLPMLPGSVQIALEVGGITNVVANDNGSGSIIGTGITGTVNYSTGAVSITFATAPASGTSIMIYYQFHGTPGAYWANTLITNDGVENLSIDNTNSANDFQSLSISNAFNDWISGVRFIKGNESDVNINLAAHITVQDSYFYGSRGTGAESYSIEEFTGSDNLFINNIFQHIPVGVIQAGSGIGTVTAYNYDYDCYFRNGTTTADWMIQCFGQHETGTMYSLYEGNVLDGIGGDTIHGPHSLNTIFRNRLYGQDLVNNYSGNTTALPVEPFTRFINIIGNVLGDPGYTLNYQQDYPNGTNYTTADIYVIGWGYPSSLVDTLSGTTLMRWGNYDTVNGATRWDSQEVPSALSGAAAAFSNPVPSTEQLPPSFFLTSKPAFWVTPWGTPPWPAIGPDVTGGDATVNGHAYSIPAQLCFANTPIDPAYGSSNVLLFNADACYEPAPAPPANLTAAIQ